MTTYLPTYLLVVTEVTVVTIVSSEKNLVISPQNKVTQPMKKLQKKQQNKE